MSFFGTIVTPTIVRDDVLTMLQTWLPTYIAEVERQRDLPERSIPMPRSWTMPPDVMMMGDHVSPTVMVLPPTLQSTDRAGDGRVSGWWEVVVGVGINAGREVEGTARLIGDYLGAIMAVVEQQRPSTAEAKLNVLSQDATVAVAQQSRAVAMGTVTAQMYVRSLYSRRLGPPEPPENPYDILPPRPTVASANVVVEKS